MDFDIKQKIGIDGTLFAMEPVYKKAKLNTQDFAIRHEMIRNGQCELSIYDDPVSGIWRITYKFIPKLRP